MAISDLAKRLKGTIKENKNAYMLSDYVNEGYIFTTPVPALNIASSGSLDGGVTCGGITQIVGDSKSFKTCFALLHAASYLQKYEDGMLVVFDSEGGASFDYFKTFNIPPEKVLVIPISDVEELKQQIMSILANVTRGEHVIFIIDSLGLLASRKEINDAEAGKDTVDMTRAKSFTSFWRMVTGKLKLLQLRMFAINHYYETMSLYPTKVVKGGKGGEWASDTIWFISRSKIRENNETAGFKFTITVMKSREIIEDAKIPIEVRYDGGIDVYSGLLDIARATGHIESGKKGWYTRVNVEDDKSWRRAEMDSEFWKPVLEDRSFKSAVENLYKLNNNSDAMLSSSRLQKIIDGDDIEFNEETGEIL